MKRYRWRVLPFVTLLTLTLVGCEVGGTGGGSQEGAAGGGVQGAATSGAATSGAATSEADSPLAGDETVTATGAGNAATTAATAGGTSGTGADAATSTSTGTATGAGSNASETAATGSTATSGPNANQPFTPTLPGTFQAQSITLTEQSNLEPSTISVTAGVTLVLSFVTRSAEDALLTLELGQNSSAGIRIPASNQSGGTTGGTATTGAATAGATADAPAVSVEDRPLQLFVRFGQPGTYRLSCLNISTDPACPGEVTITVGAEGATTAPTTGATSTSTNGTATSEATTTSGTATTTP